MKNIYLTVSLLVFTVLSFAQTTRKDSTKLDSIPVFPKDTIKRAVATANTNNPYVPNNIPPSANAASLGKYGDSPVSYYTGSASTGVQLYTIVSKDLSVPLSVGYHHGGIKVEEESSNVGLGVSGNFGGVVTRTIKGLDDLKNKGIPFHPLPADPENDTYFKNNIDDPAWGFPGVDTEPDIFYYNVGGQSGKFIMASGTQFPLKGIPLDRSDVDITCNLLSTGSNPPVYGGSLPRYQWVITLADGTQYTFSEQEITTTLSASSTTLQPQYYENTPSTFPAFDYNSARNGHNISAWYLTQMYSVNTLKTITFTYDRTAPYYSTSRVSANEVYQKSVLENFSSGACITPATLTNKTPSFNYSVNVTRNAYLKSIIFDNGQVDFTFSDRADIQQYFPNGDGGTLSFPAPIYLGDIEDRSYTQAAKKPQKLEQIKVKDANGRLVKQFDFSYSYFNYGSFASAETPTAADYMTQYNNLRLRLDKITEKDTAGTNGLPAHEFRYVGDTYDTNGNRLSMATLPTKTSWAKDYYGYYNGKDANNSLANTHVIPKLAFPKRIGDKTFSNYFFTIIGYSNTFDIGIDREVDTTSRTMACLTEIYYPTGGHTKFDYGFHKVMGGAGEVEATVFEATKTSTPDALVVPTGDNNVYTADIEFKLQCSFLAGTGSECLPTIPTAVGNTWYGKIQSFGNVLVSRNYSDWANKTCVMNGSVTNCTYTYTANNTSMPTGTHQLSINPQTFSGQQLPIATGKMTYYKYHDTDYKEVVVGGLRMDKITDYTATGVAKTRVFSYTNTDGTSTGKQLRPATKFITGYVEQLRVADQTNPWSSGCTIKNWEVEMNAHSLTPLGSAASGNMVAYSKVRVKEVDANNTAGNGYSQYEYHNEADILPTSVLFVDIPSQPDLQNGLLTRESHYDNTGAILHETLQQNTLKSTQSSLYDGMQFLYGGVNSNGSLRLAKGLYKIPAQFWFTSQKTDRSYTGTYYLEIITNYDYSSTKHNLMLGQDSQDSKLNTLKSTMKYPNEMVDNSLDPTGVYALMVAKHLIAPVIETKTFFKNVQTSRKLVNYQSLTGSGTTFYAPKSVETQILSTDPSITQVNFLSYDARANLTKYSERNGQTTNLTYLNNTGSADLVSSITVGGGTAGTVLSRTMNYEYQPLVGLKTTTDINGYKTTSIFDNYNRLQAVKDAQNYLLGDNYYHYQNGILTPNLGISPDNTLNYVVSRKAREAQTGTALDSDVDKTTTQVQFLDGLGRATQSTLWKAAPDKSKDIITSTTLYDSYGRGYKQILVTPSDVQTGAYRSNAESLASTFYGDTSSSTETVFEPSPLNRPQKQFGAGQAWRTANKSVNIAYLLAGNNILKFDIQSNGTVNCGSSHLPSALTNTCTQSERDAQTYELRDKQGRITHKFQQMDTGFAVTAYVFDDVSGGRLAYVIPPEMYKKMGTGTGLVASFTENDLIFREGIFGYHYDNQGRLIEKHIGGAGWVRYVYDKQDRIVLEQDSKDSISTPSYYKFTKYDALSRPILSGIITGIGAYTRQTLQAAFDGVNTNTYEDRTTTLNTGLGAFYTNTSYPVGADYTVQEADLSMIMYYDDYTNWQSDTTYNFKSASAFHAQGLTKGLTTGVFVRNLETNSWYKSVNYFDYKSRPTQSFSQNHLGGIDRSEYQYRFNGEVLKMRMVHNNTIQSITEVYDFSYNHTGQKTSFKHTKDGVTQNVARYDYDGINRLKTKVFKPAGSAISSKQTGNWTDASTWLSGFLPANNDNVTINAGQTVTIPSGQSGSAGILNDKGILKNFGTLSMGKITTSDLQTVDYSWHIRGLRGINLDASMNPSLAGGKLFSFKIGYEEGVGGFFDGNIKSQSWISAVDNLTRTYTFDYDIANRILSATFSGGKPNENYSLENMTYDFNGNITSLSRKGKTGANSWGYIDQLSYIYQDNSNKIQAVNDALLVSNPNVGDFRDSSSIATQYTYNQDGSLNSDDNKKIVFEWNYLKSPKKITKGSQWKKFIYDASGKLLQTVTSTGKTTDFVGNLTYENNVLYQIAHDEGRINASGAYEYDIYDHAKNLRLSFRDSSGIAKIVTKLDYDPWGYRLKGLDYYSNYVTYNKFKTFSGKQLHDDFGFNLLSYKFRFHDPALGRFISIDPLSEQYSHNSTFAFAENKLGLGMEYEGLEMAPFEQMHSRQVIEQNKKGMTETQAQNYEAHGNKVATVFVGGALSAGIAGATLPTTALVGATTGSGISGGLTAVGGGTKTEIMNSMASGAVAGAITGGGSAVATKFGGSESIKVALNAASGYIAGGTESAVSQTLNKGKVNSGDVVRAAVVSSAFTVAGGKLGNLIDNVINKVLTNTTIQQIGKEASNLFKEAFISKTSNDINDKIKTEKK
jgi:RHS repeat-associated protein